MKNTLHWAKIIPFLLYLIIPFLLGSVTSLLAYKNLLDYYIDQEVSIHREELVNRIFIFRDFNRFEYLGGKNIFDLMPTYLFMIVFLLILAFPYLSKDRYSFQFFAVRNKGNQKLYTFLQKDSIKHGGSFSFSYHLSIGIFLGFFSSQEETLLEALVTCFLLFLTRSILLIGMSKLLFYIYLRKGELSFVLTLLLWPMLYLMINFTFPEISIMFLWDGFYWLPSLLVGGVEWFFALFLKRNLKFYL